MRLKCTLVLLLISTLSLTHARNYFDEENFASVEDETDYREGRILWPYPLKENGTEGSRDSGLEADIEELLQGNDNERQRRYLPWSYQSKSDALANTMMDFISNYKPNEKDPLDFLRDQYPLPKGNLRITAYLLNVPTAFILLVNGFRT